MMSQRVVINETTISNAQQWPYNFIIVLVFNCHWVLTEKNSPGIYWTTLVFGLALSIASTCQATRMNLHPRFQSKCGKNNINLISKFCSQTC